MQALLLKGNVAAMGFTNFVQRIVEQVDGFTQFVLARVLYFVIVGSSRVEFCLFQVFVYFFEWIYQVEDDVDKYNRSRDHADNQGQAQDSHQESIQFSGDTAHIHAYYHVVLGTGFNRGEQYLEAW